MRPGVDDALLVITIQDRMFSPYSVAKGAVSTSASVDFPEPPFCVAKLMLFGSVLPGRVYVMLPR